VIEHEHIAVERDGYVTTVTIDRPDAKNACTGDMWVTLGEMFRHISYSGARVAVLTGRGEDFCAGADLSGGGLGDGPSETSHLAAMRVLGEAMTAIYHCQIPVVAKVDGVCIGAGFGLALAADMLWCSDRARFSAIFAKRGLSLDFGTSWLLRQRIGVHKAKELALAAAFDRRVESAVPDDFTVKEYGDTAVVRFTLHVVGIRQGQRAETNLRYTDVWVLREGRWLCVSSHSTQVRTEPSPAQ